MKDAFAAASVPTKSSKPKKQRTNGDANRLSVEDRAAHDWYRFVLSYPPHLVREYNEQSSWISFTYTNISTPPCTFCGRPYGQRTILE